MYYMMMYIIHMRVSIIIQVLIRFLTFSQSVRRYPAAWPDIVAISPCYSVAFPRICARFLLPLEVVLSFPPPVFYNLMSRYSLIII